MKRIWAIGASVRALAQSLVRAGYEVLAADLFNDLDLQRIAATQRIVDYPQDLLQLGDAVQADGFIYTGGLENYPHIVDALAARITLLGNSGGVLKAVRNVPVLQQVLARHGFRFPAVAKSLPAAAERWLRKSSRSSGGLRVAWASPHDQSLQREEYYQPFITGPAYGASFVAYADGAQLLGVARQLTDCSWTRAPAFLYPGSLGPVSLPAHLRTEVQRLGSVLAAEFGLRGWFGIDFVVDRDLRLWVLEVNPRYTASMELLGADSVVQHIAACQGQRVAWSPRVSSAQALSGKAVLYTSQRTIVTPALSDWLFAQPQIADIPARETELPARSPLVSLFAQGGSEEEVLAILQTCAEHVNSALNR